MRSFLRRICSLIMVMMLCLPAVFTVNAAADDAGSRLPEDTQNLLVNPDWENGTDGWLILANSIKVGSDQDDCLTSIVCQDIPVDDFMYGKAVKLTGSIAVAAEDPTQEAIEISLVMYGSDGNRIRDEYGELLYEEHMTAEDPVMTECGIIMEIPEEAASIRVLMQIWKQGDENIFNFSDLSLELTDVTEIQKPPTNENSGFIRETPIEETEPETTTEPSAESPAATPSEGTGEYTRLEYIAADGTQYIDTGYCDPTGTIIEYRAEWYQNAKGNYDGYMVGARGRDGNGRNGGYYGWNSWILGYGTNYEESNEPAFREGKAYDVRSSTVAGDAWLEVDGIRIAENTDVRGLSPSPIMVFTTESQLSDELNTCGRIFYARIYDHSGNLVRDYVPCIRNYDGAAGMFDLVENRFYGNDGTGEFRSGPILDITLYESGGQQLTPPTVDPETETDDIETGRTETDDTGRLNENEIRYMQDGSVMYNGHRYKIIQEAMYWEDAWDYCDELGGYLVTITSAQEQALMEKILKDSDAHGKFMIGLGSLDGDLRNAFEWITKEPLEYTNWGEGEPDGGQPVCILSTEDISGSHFHIRPYQWDDDTYNQYFFICEWEPETIVSSIPFNDIESQNTDTAYLKDLVEQGKGYYYGTGPEGYSRDKAEQCFKEAADNNYGEGWYYLGNMYMNSLMDQPYVRAMECYQKAVDRGFGLGLVCQALLYENGYGAEQDFAKAYELYSMAVEAGFQEGCCGLGNLYKDGNGVLQDELAAMEYYKMALDSQDFMWRNFAKCMIGKMYEKGAPGIPQDYSQAMDWYLQAAEEGYGRGYCCIGDMYFYGNGVEKDRGEAFGWFKLAAEHGDITGMYDTAFLLDHALGVTQDYTEAMKYYRMAASIGDADAMYALGCMYEEGHGVSQDFEQAKYWLEQALKYAGDDIELKESIGEEMAYISSGAY